MARIAEEAGADAISLVNTFLAMAIEPKRAARALPTSLRDSRPCHQAIALRMVYEASKAVKILSSAWVASAPARMWSSYMLAGAYRRADWHVQLLDPCGTETVVDELTRCAPTADSRLRTDWRIADGPLKHFTTETLRHRETNLAFSVVSVVKCL